MHAGASFNAPGWIAGGGGYQIAGNDPIGSATFTAPTEAIFVPVETLPLSYSNSNPNPNPNPNPSPRPNSNADPNPRHLS